MRASELPGRGGGLGCFENAEENPDEEHDRQPGGRAACA